MRPDLSVDQIFMLVQTLKFYRRLFNEALLCSFAETPEDEYEAYAKFNSPKTDTQYISFFTGDFTRYTFTLCQFEKYAEVARLIDCAMAFYVRNYPELLTTPAFVEINVRKLLAIANQLMSEHKFAESAVKFKEAIALSTNENLSGIRKDLISALCFAGQTFEAKKIAHKFNMKEHFQNILRFTTKTGGIELLMAARKGMETPSSMGVSKKAQTQGNIELKNRNYKLAAELFQQAIDNYDGPNDLDLAHLYYNLGVCYTELKNECAKAMLGVARNIAVRYLLQKISANPTLPSPLIANIIFKQMIWTLDANHAISKMELKEGIGVIANRMRITMKEKFLIQGNYLGSVIQAILILGIYTLAFSRAFRQEGLFAEATEVLESDLVLMSKYAADNPQIAALTAQVEKELKEPQVVPENLFKNLPEAKTEMPDYLTSLTRLFERASAKARPAVRASSAPAYVPVLACAGP